MVMRLNLDPPKWKVIVAVIVIILSDLYVGIGVIEESMSPFVLVKTIGLAVIHALILGFTFLSTEEAKEGEG